eukprot:308181-Prymnesium_polylepis.1
MLSIKAYGWEEATRRHIGSLRDAEAAEVLVAHTMRGINNGLYFAAPAAASLALFGTHRLINGVDDGANSLHIDTAYSALALLNVLRLSIGKHLQRASEFLPEALVAARRMQRFLVLPATQSSYVSGSPTGASQLALEMDDASFSWERDAVPAPPPASTVGDAAATAPAAAPMASDAATTGGAVAGVPRALADLTLSVARGRLVGVTGPVGCGKTALLQAVLGELRLESGSMRKGGDGPVGFYPQTGWVIPGSLRYNITLRAEPGAGDDERRLERVLDACCLRPDLALFPGGKEQELGERGVNLSGGQQARVSLARVCFLPGCSLALLDDPLAAVDGTVAAHLLEHAILRCLVREREAAVLLITHNEAALAAADDVVVMGEGGTITRRGAPATLGYVHAPSQAAAEIAVSEAPAVSEGGKGDEGVKGGEGGEGGKGGDGGATGGGLTLPEDRELGRVRLATLVSYVRAAGTRRVLLVMVLMVAAQSLLMAADFSLAELVRGGSVEPFVAFCTTAAGAAVLRAVLFFATTLRASTSLHGAAFSSVLSAPMW